MMPPFKGCAILLLMFVNNLPQVAFEIGPIGSFGPIEVRYYSLMFGIGIIGCYFITRWLWKRSNFPVKHFDMVAIYLFFGLFIGARLGEVLFYNPVYYFSNPLSIFKTWEGGLSSHGATIGVFVAYLLFWLMHGKKKHRNSCDSKEAAAETGGFKFAKYPDILCIAFPLVAGFVRIGNFFNSEILGKPTDLPWGVIFTRNGETFARHPTQIYEALIAWGIFAILLILYLKGVKRIKGEKVGKESALTAKDSTLTIKRAPWAKNYFFLFTFIGLYFLTRFLIEFLKEYQVSFEGPATLSLSMGQILSIIPFFIALSYFIFIYPKLNYPKTNERSNSL